MNRNYRILRSDYILSYIVFVQRMDNYLKHKQALQCDLYDVSGTTLGMSHHQMVRRSLEIYQALFSAQVRTKFVIQVIRLDTLNFFPYCWLLNVQFTLKIF